MGGALRRNPALLAFLAVVVAIFGCGWAIKDSSDDHRRALDAGEAELDRLPLPSDWHVMKPPRLPNRDRVVQPLGWGRTYQATGSTASPRPWRGVTEVYEILVEVAVSAGYHEVDDDRELDLDCPGICGLFKKGQYDLDVLVEGGCAAPPSMPASPATPASAATSASNSAGVEPGCVTIDVSLRVAE